ncbi:MAG: hypothetical protein ACOCYU_04270 [Brevefilum sp.]
MSRQTGETPLNSFLNPITLVTGVILLVGMILAGAAVLFLARVPVITSDATPVITMIPAPSLTPKLIQPSTTPAPTATTVFFLPEGVIGVGAYVQVSGTEGAGLRMRAEPGLDGAVNFTALDAEVFLVIDGPAEEDGYQWWHLEAPYDENRNGWSAGDFLTPIEEQE